MQPQRFSHYGLKTASLGFKISSTAFLVLSAGLLGWNWFVSLTVLSWNRAEFQRAASLGNDLFDLAWNQPLTFVSLLAIQAVAYSSLWALIRLLYRRMGIRRRVRWVLFGSATCFVALNALIWFLVPFVDWVRPLIGIVGIFSAAALVLLALPAVWRMWFFTRWTSSKPTRVVIVGGGFAGLYTALGLDRSLGYHSDLDIVLIDQKNFFLFPPLLPSAAAGTIELPQVTYPYRRILETTAIRYQKATVTSVNPVDKMVHMHVHVEGEATHDDLSLPYDYLVLAPGSTNQTFQTKGAEDHALFVKDMSDAIAIRNRIINNFERAAVLSDEQRRRELVSFAVVGGGPTGIEIATEIYDLIHEVLLKRYPEIDASWPRVTLIQSGPQVLPGWPEPVVKTTTAQLQRLGVQLVLNNRVTEVRRDGVVLKEGASVQARTVLWCAGVQPSPLLRQTGLVLDKGGRAVVNQHLQAEGFEQVFVMGDSAAFTDPKTQKQLPPLGQVAFQQGDYLAKALVRRLRGEAVQAFQYFNFGSLVSVGEHYAAVTLLGIRLKGFIGWIVWRSLYLAKIIGFSNKIRIVLDWTLDLLIERSISQLQEEKTETEISLPEKARREISQSLRN